MLYLNFHLRLHAFSENIVGKLGDVKLSQRGRAPMRTREILVISAAFVALLFAFGSAWAQSASPDRPHAPIGKVVSATGSVTIEHAVAVVLQANLPSGPKQARVGDFVYLQDAVSTGADAAVSITFADGTAFNLSANARMELNEFVYDPKSQSNSSLFSVAKGTFTFVAGSVAKTGDMKIDTPVGVMGIRGTTPHVEVSEDGKVSFSTLIEDKDGNPAGSPSSTQPRSRATTPGGSSPLTPGQADSYNRLFKFEPKLCRGC
jgi:hypothetical protein